MGGGGEGGREGGKKGAYLIRTRVALSVDGGISFFVGNGEGSALGGEEREGGREGGKEGGMKRATA